MSSFKQFYIYVDEDGDFKYATPQENGRHAVAVTWYRVGFIEREESGSLHSMFEWVINECPDEEFPAALTDDEIEEIREIACEDI